MTGSGKVTLAEVNISNGRALLRRFTPGTPTLYRTLLEDGFVHRNLVLTAVDSQGRVAVGCPLRTWKPGPRS